MPPIQTAKNSENQAVITRYTGNPIITPERIPGKAVCVFNSGVSTYNNQTIMLINCWDEEWSPQFLVARSNDGIHFEITSETVISPPEEYPYVRHEGIFDTRITKFNNDYLITYNVASHLGGRIRLVKTNDFETFEDLGFITGPDHRNCVIFSQKVNGRYARLERPNVGDSGDIYISYSPDLIHWGDTKLVLERNSRYWESAKIGPGAPPLLTPYGWLCLYHGCRQSMNGYSYQMGAMLLDLEDPSTVIGKCQRALMTPQTSYECNGLCPNVVFPTGVLVNEETDEVRIYYGAADTSMCLATTNLSDLIYECSKI